MQYWSGYMNWPLNPTWKCETCGGRYLIWGFVHAECRCDDCHTQYYMRDEDNKITDTPISMLKEEYKQPAKDAWAELRIPVDELTDEQWEEYGVVIEVQDD